MRLAIPFLCVPFIATPSQSRIGFAFPDLLPRQTHTRPMQRSIRCAYFPTCGLPNSFCNRHHEQLEPHGAGCGKRVQAPHSTSDDRVAPDRDISFSSLGHAVACPYTLHSAIPAGTDKRLKSVSKAPREQAMHVKALGMSY
jgi:hypothetical protein